jgi:hypothetical protein
MTGGEMLYLVMILAVFTAFGLALEFFSQRYRQARSPELTQASGLAVSGPVSHGMAG